MEQETDPGLSLEQKVLATATSLFAGCGTMWLINDIPDVVTGSSNPYETVKDTIFNIGVSALAYISAAVSLYLTKLFPQENNPLQ